MGKTQKKTGKGRLDKFYRLAKEQGYRARSAFKLIHLNKKYNFLYRSRVLIDLCAAPGGWLQVASKYMPVSSIIVGVDLVPIKPIKNVTTLVDDITTDKCRVDLRKQLKTWKADVVLHDGSPNMGTTWLQDAYTQSELTLKALKLATEFLIEGGTFISKVFRSKDYNALLWVFNQLFKKVDVTKPSSSRNVSAEIYVVCTGFLAPTQLDPKLLDGKHVFSELPDQIKRIDIFHPEKRKRNREGYEEGTTIFFKATPVVTFVQSPDPVLALSSYSEFTFEGPESQALLKLPETTADVQEAVKDLKVLGRKDFKLLLKWRLQMRKVMAVQRKAAGKAAAADDKEVEETSDDVVRTETEEISVDEEIAQLQNDLARKSKREKRRALLEKAKQRERMRLEMDVPNDTANYISEEGLFSIRTIKSQADLEHVVDGDNDPEVDDEEADDEDDDDDATNGDDDDDIADDDALEGEDADRLIRLRRMERELEEQYHEFKMRKDPKRALQSRDAERRRRLDTAAVLPTDDDVDSRTHPLLRDPGATQQELDAHRKTALWFSQPIFAKALGGLSNPDVDDDEDDEEGDARDDDDAGQADGGDAGSSDDDDDDAIRRMNSKARGKTGKRAAPTAAGAKGRGDDDGSDDDDDEVLSSDSAWSEDDADDIDSDDDDDASSTASGENEGIEVVPASKQSGLPLTPEQLALARVLMEKGREALVDQGFNRYATNDNDALPSWFEEEEHKFRIPSQPVTKADVAEWRAKMKELDARPIKKVAEAKARKKRRAESKMEKLRKKADVINESTDISEREKASSITKLMRNKEKKKDTVSVVVARGSSKGSRSRPTGVKGRYKMVDARMRKDLRAAKASEKKKGRSSKGGKKGGGKK